MNMEFLKELSALHLPKWAEILIYTGTLLFLVLVKTLIFRFLERWAKKRNAEKIRILLKALNRSLGLIFLSLFVALVPAVFDLPKRWDKVINFIAKGLIILSFALFAQNVLLWFHDRYFRRSPSLKVYSGISRVLIIISIYSIFLLIFLDSTGISITPLIASLGVGSVAVAFALQETLSSLFAGFYLISDQSINVGDYVKLETGEEGYVESMGWRISKIRMLQNNLIVVPNSKLAKNILTNYNLPGKELAVLVQCGVDYASDLEKVERVTNEVSREIMKEVQGGVPDFEPFIRYNEFGDSSIKFTVILRGKSFEDNFLIKHEFIKRLHRRYRDENISIPFPIRTLDFRDGSRINVETNTTRSV